MYVRLTRKFCKSDSNTEIMLSDDDFDFPPASQKCRNLSQSPVADDSNTIDFAYDSDCDNFASPSGIRIDAGSPPIVDIQTVISGQGCTQRGS